MEQKHKDLLKFFADNENEYFSAEMIPAPIRFQFDAEMEIHDYLHEIEGRKLIESNPKKTLSFKITPTGSEVVKSFQKKPSDEITLMNIVLTQLNTKDISHCHYLDELVAATSIDKNTLEVICKKIDKLGDCGYHPDCISITGQGKYKVKQGGYKDEKMESSVVNINMHGDNPFIANQSSFLDKVTVKPIKENITNTNPKPVKKLSWLEIVAYIAGIIGTIVLLYQFFKSS